MTCAKCAPNFFEEDGVENWTSIELCPLHALTERLVADLRELYKLVPTRETKNLLAEYDAARKA